MSKVTSKPINIEGEFMKRIVCTIVGVALATFVTSCGQDRPNLADEANVEFGDYLGERANTARDYMSDRNISSEDVGQGYTDARDDVAKAYVDGKDETGEQANEAREHMSDRNVSGEDVAQGYVDAKDDVGSQANEAREHMSDRGVSSEEVGYKVSKTDDETGESAQKARDHMYDRGIDEMRNGDSDHERKIADHNDRLDDAERRLAAIESVNKLQSKLIDVLFSLSSAETSARESADSAIDNKLMVESAAREAGDASEMMARVNSDLTITSSFNQQLTEQSEFYTSSINDLQDQIDSLSSELSSQGSDIATIESRLDFVDTTLAGVSSRVSTLESAALIQAAATIAQGVSFNIQLNIERVARIFRDNQLANQITSAASTAASQLASAVSGLQTQINTLTTSIGSVNSTMSIIQADLDAAEASLQTASQVQAAITAAVSASEALDSCKNLVVGSQSVVVTNRGFDGVCGSWPQYRCESNDFDATVTINVPTVSCN